MADYLLLMHSTGDGMAQDWDTYLTWLGDQGVLRGGSAIGGGMPTQVWKRAGNNRAPRRLY